MTLNLPGGSRMAVALTFDFDAHSPWMGTGRPRRPTCRVATSAPRGGVPGCWMLGRRPARDLGHPGHDLVTFPHRIESWRPGTRSPRTAATTRSCPTWGPTRSACSWRSQLRQHEQVVGRRPRGYRSPAWDFSESTLGLLEEFGFDWDSSLMGREFEPYRPRRVTVNYESASEFGPESRIVEFPVVVPRRLALGGVRRRGLPRSVPHRDMEAAGTPSSTTPTSGCPVRSTCTMHPQTIGRAHHVAAFEDFLS